jgi:hypothetical protein
MDSGKSHGRATESNFNTPMAVQLPGSNRNAISRCCRADSKSMKPVIAAVASFSANYR